MGASKIRISKKENQSYFEYLLNKCSQDKKRELIDLLRIQIDKFSNGDSSVSKVRAQSLLDSMVYTLSIYLKQYNDKTAIQVIDSKSIQEVYKDALLCMKYLMGVVMNEVDNIQSTMIIIDYQIYNETLKDGFNAFLKYYNYEYNALDSIITFDYPLLCPIHTYEGIELFYQYVNYIKLENSFCQSFDYKLIQDILHYYKKDYQLYIFNISELILNQMLLSAMINQDIHILIFDEFMLKKIYASLDGKTKLEIYHLFVNIYYECMSKIGIKEQKVIQYFYQGLTSLSSRIYYSCLYKNLDKEIAYVKSHNA